MGLLQLAGAVGGMGAGLSKGLEQMNQGIITSGLQQDERKFANEKLQQQLAHAERLQGISEAGATARTDKQISAQRDIATEGRDSAEAIAAENVLSQKEIHAATNEANKEIHRLTNAETRHATDSAASNSKQVAIAKVIDTIADENQRYAIILNDLKSDPNNPEYKNVTKKLQKNNIYLEAYRQRLGELSGTTLPTVKERPALVLPGRSGTPGVTPSTDALDQSSSVAPVNPNPLADISTKVEPRDPYAAAKGLVPGLGILQNILKK